MKKVSLSGRTKAIRDRMAYIRTNREIAPGVWRMDLQCDGISFTPGQFFQLRLDSSPTLLPDKRFSSSSTTCSTSLSFDPLLRRPFAPCEVREDGFAFVYAVVGRGTAIMTQWKRGDAVQVLAPLGHGYRLPRRSSRAILVGGGCGAPSLCPLAEVLAERGWEILTVLGARTASTLLEEKAFRRTSHEVIVATDDGSRGFHGTAIEALEHLLDRLGSSLRPSVFACGPEPMLKGVARVAATRDLRCQVSLEVRMACGFGACMGCAVPVRAETPKGFCYQRVCVEGPVFDTQDLWAFLDSSSLPPFHDTSDPPSTDPR